MKCGMTKKSFANVELYKAILEGKNNAEMYQSVAPIRESFRKLRLTIKDRDATELKQRQMCIELDIHNVD
jgi:hypothetical protein